MKLKELFELLEKTEFHIFTKRWKGNIIVDEREDMHMSLNGFGSSNYSGSYDETFTFKIIKNGSSKRQYLTKVFSRYNEIEQNLLDLDIVEIERITLDGYVNESNSGNGYYNNSSSMIICLKDNSDE